MAHSCRSLPTMARSAHRRIADAAAPMSAHRWKSDPTPSHCECVLLTLSGSSARGLNLDSRSPTTSLRMPLSSRVLSDQRRQQEFFETPETPKSQCELLADVLANPWMHTAQQLALPERERSRLGRNVHAKDYGMDYSVITYQRKVRQLNWCTPSSAAVS